MCGPLLAIKCPTPYFTLVLGSCYFVGKKSEGKELTRYPSPSVLSVRSLLVEPPLNTNNALLGSLANSRTPASTCAMYVSVSPRWNGSINQFFSSRLALPVPPSALDSDPDPDLDPDPEGPWYIAWQHTMMRCVGGGGDDDDDAASEEGKVIGTHTTLQQRTQLSHTQITERIFYPKQREERS